MKRGDRFPVGWLKPCLWVAVFVPALASGAQDTAPQAFTVRGTVVNSLTNQPIARAQVVLNQEYAVLTDAEGRFEFAQIVAGQYAVAIRRPGYLDIGSISGPMVRTGRTFLMGPPSAPLQIRVGPDMPGLTFRLAPEGAITGHVSLSAADPADGIRVSIYRKGMLDGRPRWQMAGMATTNSEGIFRFGDLPPGSYLLYTQPSLDRPGVAMSGAVEWGFPSVYYPGVTDPAAAGILAVSAGQTVDADVALTRQAFYPVTASVQGADLGQGMSFQVLDRSGRPTGMPARYDSQTQTVHASVPNGRWLLDGKVFGRTRMIGEREFQVGGAPVTLAITIAPPPRVPVTIRKEFTVDDKGNPAMAHPRWGVNIQFESAEAFGLGESMVSNHFEPPDPASDSWSGSLEARPGTYWVETSLGPGYVSSITSGGVDLMSGPLVISASGSASPIEVVLRNDSGTISGQITELTVGGVVGGVQQAHVYAIPLFATSTRLPESWSQSNGQFNLANLPPGTYRVVACDSPQEIEYHTQEGLAGWAGKGQVVRVDPGGTTKVQLDLLHMEAQP